MIEFWYALICSVRVASPGPPAVSTNTWSKIFRQSMNRKITATRMYGHIIGSISRRNM